MTRGKNATAAAGRRYQADHDAQIETYQRKVAELTAAKKALEEQIETDREKHRAMVLKLSEQVREGSSAGLDAAQALISELRVESGKLRRESNRNMRKGQNLAMTITKVAMSELGLPEHEATQWVNSMMNGNKYLPLSGFSYQQQPSRYGLRNRVNVR